MRSSELRAVLQQEEDDDSFACCEVVLEETIENSKPQEDEEFEQDFEAELTEALGFLDRTQWLLAQIIWELDARNISLRNDTDKELTTVAKDIKEFLDQYDEVKE